MDKTLVIEKLKKAFKLPPTDSAAVLEKAKGEPPTLDYSQWQKPMYASDGKVKPTHQPYQHMDKPRPHPTPNVVPAEVKQPAQPTKSVATTTHSIGKPQLQKSVKSKLATAVLGLAAALPKTAEAPTQPQGSAPAAQAKPVAKPEGGTPILPARVFAHPQAPKGAMVRMHTENGLEVAQGGKWTPLSGSLATRRFMEANPGHADEYNRLLETFNRHAKATAGRSGPSGYIYAE